MVKKWVVRAVRGFVIVSGAVPDRSRAIGTVVHGVQSLLVSAAGQEFLII